MRKYTFNQKSTARRRNVVVQRQMQLEIMKELIAKYGETAYFNNGKKGVRKSCRKAIDRITQELAVLTARIEGKDLRA